MDYLFKYLNMLIYEWTKSFKQENNSVKGIIIDLVRLYDYIHAIFHTEIPQTLLQYETQYWLWQKLEITKGYGVRPTTIEGQNAFAPTMCFA